MLLSRRQVTIEQKQSVGDSMQHLDLHFYCELWFAECRGIHYAGLIQYQDSRHQLCLGWPL